MPALQPTSRKADLVKHHSEPGTFRPMFRHFQYPAKVPAIPDKIHRGLQSRGRINVTVNEAEMHPSYVSHQNSRLLTPESLSQDSEEELLLRAEEGSSDEVSEPPSLTESEEEQISREEQQFEQAPPYQAMEEEHYRSFRSSSSARPPSVLSSKSVEVQVEPVKPKKKKKKKPKPKPSPPSSLSPLEEVEEKPKAPHKAKAPPAFPAHQSPQFFPQPIIYQMPQPFPMPFPIYPPTPQYYYPPYYQSPPPVYRPPSPEQPVQVVHKRERSTQYATVAKETKKPVETPSPRGPSFGDVLADIDRRLTTPVPDTTDVKYRRAVALEIGIGESKSLAERFQQKLPTVNAKLNSRDSERPRIEHKDKSTTELLEIRKELLRHGNSPRTSVMEEAPWRGDAAQIEKADRLAAGNSTVIKRQREEEERGRRSALSKLVVTNESGMTVATREVQTRREDAARQGTEKVSASSEVVPKNAAKPGVIDKPGSKVGNATKTENAIQKPEQLAKAAVSSPKLGAELSAPAKPGLKPGLAKPGPENSATIISGSIQLGTPSTVAKLETAIAKPGAVQLGVPSTPPAKLDEKSAGVATAKQGVILKPGPDIKQVPTKPGPTTSDTPARVGEPLPAALTPKAEALPSKAGVSNTASTEPSKSVLAKPGQTSSGSSIPSARPEERSQTVPFALTPKAVLEALSPKAGAKFGSSDVLSKPGLRVPGSETPSFSKDKAPGFEALATKASVGVAGPKPGTDTPTSVVSAKSAAEALAKPGSDTPKSALFPKSGAMKPGAKIETVVEESKEETKKDSKPAGRPVKMQ